MKVLLYGRLRDSIGREVEVEAPTDCSVAELRSRLAKTHPEAADSLARSRALIAGSLVSDTRQVRTDDQVEFLPPVSGG